MLKENSITLGSLFDGIGAFPYAASFFRITPLWASEILPNSISITKRQFPYMTHLGDIMKLDGGKIPPVDILCFGSPCQSFSVAGPRTAFAGKSGLFFEAIRIINEMRCATNGNYPKIAIFENVPGVLNIDRGRSYKTIIEAFCETEIPMPVSGKWANAGMVRGGSVDFAWVCKDAQHYRVPQRRKRLFAIADFTGQRAAEILFKSESLSGYFAAREFTRQGTPADAESGADGAGSGINGAIAGTLDANYGKGTGMRGGIERDVILCAATGQSNAEILRDTSPTLNCNCEQPIIYAKAPQKVAAFMAGQAKNARSIAYNETLSPTLKGAASGLNQTPSILCMATGQSDGTAAANEDLSPTLTLNHEAPYICKEQTAYGICSQSSNSMRSGNPHSGIYEAETCKTLDQSCANPVCNQGGIAVVEPKIARTLTARHDSSPCVDRGQNVVAFAQNQRDEIRALNDVAGCLAAYHGVKQQTYVVHPEITGTLCGSGAGTSRTAGNCNETDLAVAYCLQGNMIGRADKNGPMGSGVNEELCFNITAADRHAIATFSRQRSDSFKQDDISSTQTARQYKDATDIICQQEIASVDCRNLSENEEMSGTLQSKCTGGYSLNYQNPVRTGYVIRRLTPVECERLMAFPDEYTAIGHDGKVMSDSTRYQMLGNSIVVNVLAYIMQNIAEQLGSNSV